MARDPERQIEMLFDDHDRDLLGQLLQAVMTRRSRRSRRPRSARRATTGADSTTARVRTASIFRSPPDNVPASWFSRAPSLGKSGTRSVASLSRWSARRLRDCPAPIAARTRNTPAEHSRGRAERVFSVGILAISTPSKRSPPPRTASSPMMSSSGWFSRRRCGRVSRQRHAADAISIPNRTWLRHTGIQLVDLKKGLLRHDAVKPPEPSDWPGFR